MYFLAISSGGSEGDESPIFAGAIHGLKLLAVVVVSDAVLGMFRSFCAGKLKAGLCVATAGALLLLPGIGAQFAALVVCAAIGVLWLQSDSESSNGVASATRVHWMPLGAFAALFCTLPFLSGLVWVEMFGDFFQVGSLVFGGGHVVLPLLQNSASVDVHRRRAVSAGVRGSTGRSRADVHPGGLPRGGVGARSGPRRCRHRHSWNLPSRVSTCSGPQGCLGGPRFFSATRGRHPWNQRLRGGAPPRRALSTSVRVQCCRAPRFRSRHRRILSAQGASSSVWPLSS